MLSAPLWHACLAQLESELTTRQLDTWIKPLQAEVVGSGLRLLAPNRFVLDWVEKHYLDRIIDVASTVAGKQATVALAIGHHASTPARTERVLETVDAAPARSVAPAAAVERNRVPNRHMPPGKTPFCSELNPNYTFEGFVEGKSNHFGRAAAMRIAENPGCGYNPLFIYGGVGLGKTHLMQAVGHALQEYKPDARIAYVHSERYVREMIKALQRNTIDDFKQFYRSLDALLIDDIQFFAGKERSQEEFFHNFNAMMESRQQIIITCDRYPKEVDGLEERLRSRFGWGLTVSIDPPELETRVAILHSKAEQSGVELPSDVAFFIAKRVRSNVRELEGALRRVIATCQFTGQAITVDFAREALRDLISVQDKLITLTNIQKTVAEYYKIPMKDLLSKRRTRSIARPRQLAMALSKEMTTHSLPEIGDAFGGRDHTTVMHACKTIARLRETDSRLNDDYLTLRRAIES
ncbi:MAG: chromosomal replication initiator protein DnaA [Pseudomonadota bacterium]